MATLSYEIDGSVLTLRASGTPTLAERAPVFDAVRVDARVPYGALLLIDVREVDTLSAAAAIERVHLLIDGLSEKLGPVCALVVSPALIEQWLTFKTAGSSVGLRVKLFSHELSARHWLKSLP